MAVRPFAGQTPNVGNDVFIDETAVIIGDVTLADNASVWPHCSLRGDLLSIHIGNNTNIQDQTIIHTTHQSQYHQGAKVQIGDSVTIGHGAIIHGCTIQDLSLVGMGAIILDHAVVESFVIVGAGSVVGPNKVLESGYVWLGNPVRKARALTEEERQFMRYSADNYVKLKNKYLLSEPNNLSKD